MTEETQAQLPAPDISSISAIRVTFHRCTLILTYIPSHLQIICTYDIVEMVS